MKALYDLNVKLSEGEKVLACDKKDNSFYFLMSSVFVLLYVILLLFGYMFTDLGIVYNISCVVFFIVILACIFEVNKGRPKRLYLTNKRFIILENNKIETVKFSMFDRFYRLDCGKIWSQFQLYTKDDRCYTFLLSECKDIVNIFIKIYPQCNVQYVVSGDNRSDIFFLAICNLALIGVACNMIYDGNKIKEIDSRKNAPECSFSDRQQYFDYIANSVRADINRQNLPMGTFVNVDIKEDGTLLNISLFKKLPQGGFDTSNIEGLNGKKLCPFPNGMNLYGKQLSVKFPFN